MTFEIAKRKAVPALIAIAGPSGSGKTLSALLLAAGLAGDGKVGFIDTELGRGAMYADDLDVIAAMPGGKYFIKELSEPFTPIKLVDAIKDAIKAGVKVLIIDSASHFWEGSGGCQDIAENNKLRGMPNWAMAKNQHKKLMNVLTQAPMHIIICLRARAKTKPVKDKDGKIEMVECGMQPIQEKNFMYEMTLSIMMSEERPGKPKITKCPKPLLHLFSGNQALINKSIGEKLRTWSESGEIIDTEARNLKREFRDAAGFGGETLKAIHARTAKESPELLKRIWSEDFAEEVKGLANEADNIAAQQKEEEELNTKQEKLFKGVE